MADQKQQESVATKNEVDILGVVKENKLKVDKDKVNGSLVIKYGKKKDQQVEVQVYVSETKSDGKEHNKKYDTFKELSETLVSQAKATEENPASIVRISGRDPFTPQLDLNEYANNGEIKGTPRVSLGFGNVRIVDADEKDFQGMFEMVIFLTKAPKMKGAKLEVDGLYVTYKGEVKPLSFIVEDDELIEGIEQCGKGETIEVWGEVKIAQVTETKKKSSGFGGKAKTDTKTTFTSELIITGGNPIDEDDKRAIDSDFVKKALVVRETFLENLLKEKPKNKKKQSSGGFGGEGKKKKTDDNSDDIPF